MRDINIPTSKLTGKGASAKSKLVGGLRRVASAVEENKPQQFVSEFVTQLKHDPLKEPVQ